ncbi:MAG: hypothetical protein WED13_05620 [Methyloceanibacter sp.]
MEQDDPLDREGSEQARAGDGTEPIDWEKAKHDYIHGDWSINRIAVAHGTSDTTLRKRAKAGGWVRLVGTKPLPPGGKPRPPGAPTPKRATVNQVRRRKMVKRLLEVLDSRLEQLERHMALAQGPDGTPQSATDTERDLRSFNFIMQAYAKLVALDEAASKDGQGSAAEATRSDDADQLRRDLALRLERLNRERDA